MLEPERVAFLLADARDLHQDALEMLEQDRLRNAAEKFWCRGQSVIIYQHATHQKSDKYTKAKTQLLEDKSCEKPIVVKARSYILLILPRPCHRERIEQRVQQITEGCWGRNGHLTRWAPQQQEGE